MIRLKNLLMEQTPDTRTNNIELAIYSPLTIGKKYITTSNTEDNQRFSLFLDRVAEFQDTPTYNALKEKDRVVVVRVNSINMKVDDKYKNIFEFVKLQVSQTGYPEVKNGSKISFSISGNKSKTYPLAFYLTFKIKSIEEAFKLEKKDLQIGSITMDVQGIWNNAGVKELFFQNSLTIPVRLDSTTKFVPDHNPGYGNVDSNANTTNLSPETRPINPK